MSQENVETIRRVLAVRAGERFQDLLDPAVRLDLSERVFNPAIYEGYEGIERWFAEVDDVWESYVMEPEDFIEGDNAIVVLAQERGRGTGSGVVVERELTLLFELRAGRVTVIRLYAGRDRALRDAGVE